MVSKVRTVSVKGLDIKVSKIAVHLGHNNYTCHSGSMALAEERFNLCSNILGHLYSLFKISILPPFVQGVYGSMV